MKLYQREWIAISLILSVMLSLVAISQLTQKRSGDLLQLHQQKTRNPIHITLSGEITAPGVFECKGGTTLKELLKDVTLTKQADRKKIHYKKVLLTSHSIKIPSKSTLSPRDEKISLVEN